MLVSKLLNNEITSDIVKRMIEKSIGTYNKNLKDDMSKDENRRKLIEFISDDTYEFDCLSKFSRTMIDSGINVSKWMEISMEIRKYNAYIEKNEYILNVLSTIIKYYDKSSDEFKFLNKIISSTKKNSSIGQNDQYEKLLANINFIENQMQTELCNGNVIVEIPTSELIEMPEKYKQIYLNQQKNCYCIPINQNSYELCLKYINSSKWRKYVEDTMYKKYEKYIPKIVHLLIYRHVKSNILGYKNYFEMASRYDFNFIQQVLQNIVVELDNRSNNELSIISKFKKQYEHESSIKMWDINRYINVWRNKYGIDETEISHYFELENTLKCFMGILSKLFSIKFRKISSTLNIVSNYNMLSYEVHKNDKLLGTIILDPLNRNGKINSYRTICINNKCMYPCEKQIETPVYIFMSIPCEQCKSISEPIFLTISDLSFFFCEFGKIMHYISCSSKYNLFGGMYSSLEFVQSIGKFIELIMFEKGILKLISSHYQTHKQISEEIAHKIIQQRKLNYGISYKYQCLGGLYDLFVHSQQEFITNCKKYMKYPQNEQNMYLINYMRNVYDKFYNTIFGTTEIKIQKDISHLHPLFWNSLFSQKENIQFVKILSDIVAHDIYSNYIQTKNKNSFCSELCDFITSNTIDTEKKSFNIPHFLNHDISINPMLNYFGLLNNDSQISLYQINDTNKCHNDELYVSSSHESEHKNRRKKSHSNNKHYSDDDYSNDNEESKSDAEMRSMLRKVML